MINLKELYTNAPELFDKIFENTKITIVGAKDKEEVIEKLNDEKTKYIGIRSEFDDHVSLFEYDTTDYTELDNYIGRGGNIDNVIETLDATINDGKILSHVITLGNKLPIRMQVSEAYDDRINKIMKKYGQGLKNVYDYMVSQTL